MRSLILVLGFLGSLAALAEPVRTKHVTAELVTETDTLKPGANWIGVRLEMIPEWHTYWRFPGDSGLPTEIVWHLPSGWTAGPIAWPLPKRIFVPPLVNYGYDGEALLGVPLTVPAGANGEFSLAASVSWLVCKEECVPEKAELSLRVRVGTSPQGGAPAYAKTGPLALEFARLRGAQPVAGTLSGTLVSRDKQIGLRLAGVFPPGTDFFPLVPMVIKGDKPPRPEKQGEETVFWLEKSDPFDAKATELLGMLVAKGQIREVAVPLGGAAPVASAAPKEEPSAPWLLVLFGLLGGLILNLMPCVFPVLGIKVMSLVRQGGEDPAFARRHGFAYAGGVVASFWVLAGTLVALRSAGQAVGWGFQLQQPLFVTALILLFTFVAADLAGFVRWSGRWMGVGSGLADREGLGGSFFTGVLAVVVATPCSAPFMGTAIGAAIGEPGWVLFLVFTALGLGLALPFLALCYQPAYLRALPKPGAWMERLKELFAFPIAATVLWLLWVLTLQIGAEAALKVEGGLLTLLFSVWLRRRFAGGAMQAVSWLVLLLGLALCVLGGRAEPQGVSASADGWKPFSEAAVSEAVGAGRPVFVDFTAAWCLTCQVNKKLVLDRAAMRDFFREKGVVLLLADWTNRDPAITHALESHGRIGVPLYLGYRAGTSHGEVLPQVLTEDRLRDFFR